jgi:hypothetical protein
MAAARDHFQQQDRQIMLLDDPNEFEQLLNTETAWEFMPTDHPNPHIRGMHFFTATAHVLLGVTDITDADDTGCGQLAATHGNEDQAYEFLGTTCMTGVKRMGGGRTHAQINLSTTAARGMAGATNGGMTPSHLATFFIQLHRAGTKHQETLPFNDKFKGRSKPPGTRDEDDLAVIPLPEDTLQDIIADHYEEAPVGIKRSTIDTIVRRMAASPGSNFTGRQMHYMQGFGGKVGKGTHASIGDTTIALAIGQRIANAHISLSILAVHQATATAYFAGEANLMSDEPQALILALITRKFTGNKHRKSSRLHRVTGRVPGDPYCGYCSRRINA